MRKRLFAGLLAFCLTINLMSVTAFAVDNDATLPDGITVDSFGENTVTDGSNYYATLVEALSGIHGTKDAVLYCKPGADVGTMTHGHVCKKFNCLWK